MAKIRTRSADASVRGARSARAAVDALKLMESMGLVPVDEEIEELDLAAVRSLAGAAARAGVGRAAAAALGTAREPTDEDVAELLEELARALEESPLPDHEWAAMTGLFGVEELARLVRISVASLRRYGAGDRPTPDAVAARLHLIARISADLRGAYSDVGVRRWFRRARSQLGGAAPAELLEPGWDPDDEGPERVRALARSIAGSPST